MFDSSSKTESLSKFKRQTAEYLTRLRESGEPIVLTDETGEKIVIQNASAYQKLVDTATKVEKSETISAIQEGLTDADAGRTAPLNEVRTRLAEKYGFEKD